MAGAYDNEATLATRRAIAEWLSARRSLLGYQRATVAERMEIDKADLGKLERGVRGEIVNFTWSRLYRWCRAHGVRIEFAVVGDGSETDDDLYWPRFRTEPAKQTRR